RARFSLAAVVLAALALDAFVPASVAPDRVAGKVTAVVSRMQAALGEAAEDRELRDLLIGGGGLAEPEIPFDRLGRAESLLPFSPDSLVVVDERGQPVGWRGESARLPVRLRPLGERAVVAEPGVGEVWVWWREPMFEAGRPVGAMLAGTRLPEGGSRVPLGVWTGRSAVMRPRLGGGEAVRAPSGAVVLGLEEAGATPVPWSARAGSLLVVLLLLAAIAPGWARAGLLAGAAACVWWWTVPHSPWVMPVALLALGSAASRLPATRPTRVVAGAALTALAWSTAGVIGELEFDPVPASLLGPGMLRLALMLAAAALVHAAARGERRIWWLVIPAAALLAAGLGIADVWLLGIGCGLAVLGGMTTADRAWAAAVAAAVIVGAGDADRQRALVAAAETTLARVERIEAPARALLASLPEPGLRNLVRLQPAERLVVLGRLAGWLELERELPGVSLVLLDAAGKPSSVWGEAPIEGEAAGRVVAERVLGAGWRLTLQTPPEPWDVLGALASGGVEGPVAAFDRAGTPIARGATFRPLTPVRVGQALADRRSWGTLGVGEREFSGFMRAHGDRVLALPWIRRTPAETALVVVALAFWGAAPIWAWVERRRLSVWWRRRRTFAGRVQVMLVAAAILPVVLLAQLLPRQWVKQSERARQEVGRSVGRSVAEGGWERAAPALQRELGTTVVVYRSGELPVSSRPDRLLTGAVPAMPPPEAYVRAVRGWREPLVSGQSEADVFTPAGTSVAPMVVGVFGLPVAGVGAGPSPGEWFAFTAVSVSALALLAAGRTGRRLAGPLSRLVSAVRRLETGEPVAGLESSGDEDVDAVGRAVSTMAGTVQRREEELRRERNLLERVLSTLSAAVVVAGEEGSIEMANAAGRTLLAGGESLAELAVRFDSAIAELARRAAAGESVEITLQPSSSPGTVWRVIVQPLTGASGRLLLVAEDLSVVARAQRLASLAEAARIVAHEVKNPLTPIRLWAEELQAALASGPQATVSVARQAAEQILDRVVQLREVAQGFSNLVALERWHPERVSLATLAREVLGEYQVLQQRGVEVLGTWRDEGWVSGDVTWVRRALRNLIENSVRAIGDGRGRIAVRVVRDEATVTLTVSDTGGGVPPEHLARLFEPHFSTTSQGSGLGLALVQRIVERAGGATNARNGETGLEVSLSFPAA
ncbi:MAG: ATP-binding protein, partial [Acidobacteriota bacterium]